MVPPGPVSTALSWSPADASVKRTSAVNAPALAGSVPSWSLQATREIGRQANTSAAKASDCGCAVAVGAGDGVAFGVRVGMGVVTTDGEGVATSPPMAPTSIDGAGVAEERACSGPPRGQK